MLTSNKTKITNANVCDEFYMAHIGTRIANCHVTNSKYVSDW